MPPEKPANTAPWKRDGECQGVLATPRKDPAPKACPTRRPSEGQAPSHLGGGQLQVANRLRVREQLDLLHQISVLVPTHHSLVEGPCACEETERAEIV